MNGREQLGARIARLPRDLLALAQRSPAPLDGLRFRGVVTSGIGSSRAHAEFLADCLSVDSGVPARFLSTGSLAVNAPVGSEHDLLVVFSQGLSPNAQHALRYCERFAHTLLVTAESAAGDGAEPQGEKAAWLRARVRGGVRIVPMPGRGEFGTLVRVTGAMAGFAIGLDIASRLASQNGREAPSLLFDAEAAAGRVARAAETLEAALPAADTDLAELFGAPVAFIASGGHAECVRHLSTKFMEGLLIAAPAGHDVLEFAHGPLQQLHPRRATIFFLARADADGEADWIRRVEAVLDPARHRLVVLPAALPGRAAVLEHEAMGNALLMRALDALEIDPSVWPAQGADAPLYEYSPPEPAAPIASSPAPRALATASHPEVAAFLAGGRRTAVVPLGSTEQHGPHLPFATDTWIAEALAARFCARDPDAIALPALPFGCASEHLDFEGTLHVDADTLERTLRDVLRSLVRHGFTRALVFSAHGGNAQALRAMKPALETAAAPMQLAVHTDLETLTAVLHAASAREGIAAAAAGHHAGESETSILLGLAPGSVRTGQLEPGATLPPRREVQAFFYPSLRSNAANGVVGDPSAASELRAEGYLAAWVGELERLAQRCWDGANRAEAPGFDQATASGRE